MAETSSEELIDNAIQLGEDYDQDNLNLTYRKNAQQALLFCSKTVAKKNQNFYTGAHTLPLSLPTKGYTAEQAKGTQRSWLSGYRNIVPVKSGQYPADSSVSILATRSVLSNNFFTFELSSAQMAALVPVIRVFKIDYKVDSKTKEIITKNPTKREIVFNKSITAGEIQILEAYGGNLGSAGIESFSWALKGVNPAEVDSNIEASLKIYFNNMAAFQQILDSKRHVAAGGSVGDEFFDELPASFLDLITFSPPTELDTNLPCIDKYEPEFFEILVEVGWNYSAATGLFKDYQMEALDGMKETLYLTLTDHVFDFREDGSSTLEVNYRARTTFNTAKYDVLGYSKDKKIKKEMDQLETTSEELDEDGLAESKKEEIRANMKETEVTLRQLTQTKTRELMKAMMCAAYTAKIPKALMFHFDSGEEGIVTSVSDMLAAAGDPAVSGDAGFDTLRQQVVDEYDKATANATNISIERVSKKYMDDTWKTWDATTSGQGTRGAADAGSGGVLHGATNKKFGRLSEKTKLKLQGATSEPGLENGYFSIDFVYLGDVLEVFFQTAPILTLLGEQKLAILITDVAFLNTFELLSKIELRNKKYEIKTAGQFIPYSALKCATNNAGPAFRRSLYHEINLANMPINVEILLDFMTDKIVKNNKTVYYLDDLMSDLFNELVKPIIADTGVMGVPMNQPAMINISLDSTRDSPVFPDFYSSPTPDGEVVGYYDEPRISPSSTSVVVGRFGAGYSLAGGQHVISKKSTTTDNAPGNGPYGFAQIGYLANYIKHGNPTGGLTKPVFPTTTDVAKAATIKIYGMVSQAQSFKGSYKNNMLYNIYNFVVGIDKGLVKRVKFERVDQEYLRESRVSKSRSFGAGQLRELYHVNLTLYGNNLLKPGGLIYVEPNPQMFGRPTEENSIARVLGLGGYHLVVDVSHTISKDGWETQVKAMHVSMPVGVPSEPVPTN